MEFSADTKSLGEALDQVREAVEKKSTIPILSHVQTFPQSKGRSPQELPLIWTALRQDVPYT
jgi:hypothetical protein